MIFLRHHYALITVLIVLGFVLSAAIAVLEAWMDTRQRPKEDMFWCGVHGPIRKRHCLPLFPGMTKRNGEPFVVCPLCYKKSVYDDVDTKAEAHHG